MKKKKKKKKKKKRRRRRMNEKRRTAVDGPFGCQKASTLQYLYLYICEVALS